VLQVSLVFAAPPPEGRGIRLESPSNKDSPHSRPRSATQGGVARLYALPRGVKRGFFRPIDAQQVVGSPPAATKSGGPPV